MCVGSPDVGFDGGSETIAGSRNCVSLFSCHEPDVSGVEYRLLPAGCDPTEGSCTVRADVDLDFPGNHNNGTDVGW